MIETWWNELCRYNHVMFQDHAEIRLHRGVVLCRRGGRVGRRRHIQPRELLCRIGLVDGREGVVKRHRSEVGQAALGRPSAPSPPSSD